MHALAGQPDIAGIVLLTIDTDILWSHFWVSSSVNIRLPPAYLRAIITSQWRGTNGQAFACTSCRLCRRGNFGPKVRAMQMGLAASIQRKLTVPLTTQLVLKWFAANSGVWALICFGGTSKNLLLQSAVKFWYSNKLGPLAVFPLN
ncbi:unnamed protein product [Effrenium voratum]|nr:unnamed protein product [Effrenium voratum]